MQAILDKCMCYNMLWKFDAKENLSYDYLTGLLYKLSKIDCNVRNNSKLEISFKKVVSLICLYPLRWHFFYSAVVKLEELIFCGLDVWLCVLIALSCLSHTDTIVQPLYLVVSFQPFSSNCHLHFWDVDNILSQNFKLFIF